MTTLLAKLTEKAALECEQAHSMLLPVERVSEHYQRFSSLWDAALAEAGKARVAPAA